MAEIKKTDVSNIHNMVYNGHVKQMLDKSFSLSSDEQDWIMTAIKQRLNRALVQKY